MCDLKLTNGIGYQEDVEPVDLTITHKGRLWDHKAEECRELLRSMSDLSAAMHNVTGKTKDAIAVSFCSHESTSSTNFYATLLI